MKRVFMLLLLAVISLGASAQTQQGKSSLGLNIGHAFDVGSATFGLDYRYNVTDAVRLAPSITYMVNDNGFHVFAVDMNAHYVVKLSEMFGFYPLAGLSLSFWNFDDPDPDLDSNASGSLTRFGVNLGLGAEVYASTHITVGVEAKYNIVKDLDQAMLAVRVGYNF